MELKLKLTIARAAVFLSAFTLASAAQAASISITSLDPGYIPLPGPGNSPLVFSGDLEWNNSTLTGGQILLADFCFTDDASGLPSTSPTCGALSAVPILSTGQPTYDGTPVAPGSTFQQVGTTFDGNSGLLTLTAYSPTYDTNIFIDLLFNGDGTGNLVVTPAFPINAEGGFTYTTIPVPAAAWLFGSALIGLVSLNRKH